MDIKKFIAVVRDHAEVEFSDEYCERVNRARALVDKWVDEGRVMYGITTGFGALSERSISREDTAKLQENILLSHSVSVGDPFTEEECRAVMLMVLQNLGSVGYLSPEAHMALVLIGRGKAWFEGELLPGDEALKKAGLEPMELASKEGLALVSGTTTTTALAALALYDMIKAAKSADIIAAMTLELSGGQMNAFDERVCAVRPHAQQMKTAENVRNILEDSELIKQYAGTRVQDALSLRCIPQLHGAAKHLFEDAKITIEVEMNSCCDNPIIWPEEGNETVISACNADAAYVGMQMDSACIGATGIAKMSERRNNRLIDGSLSDLPWFLIKNPGLSSGLMVPQYAQAGLLNDMRMLCTPATIDNTPTCGNQEDYVSMGYNSAKKSVVVAEKLEYILAIELLSVFEGQQFREPELKRSSVTRDVLDEIGKSVPVLEEDQFLYPFIEYLRDMIHSGRLLEIARKHIEMK